MGPKATTDKPTKPTDQERRQRELRHEHADDEQRVRHRDVADDDLKLRRRLRRLTQGAACGPPFTWVDGPWRARARAPGTRRPALPRRGAADRMRPLFAQCARVEPAAERVAQQLAPLRERHLTSLAQQRGVDVRRRQASGRMRTTAESTRGGGSNASGGTSSTRVDRVAPLQHHAQPPVSPCRRARRPCGRRPPSAA